MATVKKAVKLETIALTVSKAHYDRATKALQSNSYYVLTQCLVAQAVKSVFKGKKISVGSDDVEVGRGIRQRKFSIDKKGQALIQKFDNSEADRQKLPVTFKLTEIPASRWV